MKKKAEQRCQDILCDLIRLNSDSSRCGETLMGIYIENFLNSLGICTWREHCEQERFNVAAQLAGKNPNVSLLYCGHMDTVPMGDEKKWTSPALMPELRENKLYGRGACDMKGSIACVLAALEEITIQNTTPQSCLYFLFDVDEECQNLGLHIHLKNRLISPNLIIVGEPTSLRLAVGHRGVMAFTVTVYGKSAHAGQAQLGRNALYASAEVINEIQNLNKELEKINQNQLGRPSVYVTQITCGNRVNVIPEKAVLRIDRRLVSGENQEGCCSQVKKILEKVQQKTGCFCELKVTTYCPSGLSETSAGPIKNLQKIQKQIGLSDIPTVFEASCEAGILQESYVTPTVIIGPGNIAQAHQIDEYITLEQLSKGVEFYKVLFSDWTP